MPVTAGFVTDSLNGVDTENQGKLAEFACGLPQLIDW
jgi:hypothetical protein